MDLVAVALLSLLFFLPFLGSRPLVDWDEAIYGDIAREFTNGASRLVPYWNFHPWLERTPLLEWVTAGFFSLFGISEFTERLTSALCGAGITLITFYIASGIGGRVTGWTAAIVLLTTHGFFYQARSGTTDAMLTLWMTAGLLGIYRINSGDARGWYVFWISFALGVMTKSAGPAPLLLAAIALGLTERWSIQSFGRQFLIGAGLFVLIVAPWHVYMWMHFGRVFVDDYLVRQLLTRSLRPLEGHSGGPLFYIVTILKSAFPWSVIVVIAALGRPRNRQTKVAAIYALVILLFYTAVKTKLPWYVLPLYPALAIVAASEITSWVSAPTLRPALAMSLCIFLAGFLLIDLRRPYARPEVLLLKHNEIRLYGQPLILCSDRYILDIPAPLFYSGTPTVQAYFLRKPDALEGVGRIDPMTNDAKFRNPLPLSALVTRKPSPILIDKRMLRAVEERFDFREIASDAQYQLGIILSKS